MEISKLVSKDKLVKLEDALAEAFPARLKASMVVKCERDIRGFVKGRVTRYDPGSGRGEEGGLDSPALSE